MFSFSGALWLFTLALVVTDGHPWFPSQFTVITCGRGNVHSLVCESGVIVVVAARYGSKEGTCCSSGSIKGPANPQCLQLSATGAIREKCEGKHVCEVNTGPCTGPCYVEYLQTWYNCAPIVDIEECEHATVLIQCDPGKVIKLLEVLYGRQDPTTCSEGRTAAEVEDVTCASVDALTIVMAQCDGLPECTFIANGSVFPDPCPPTYKYLQVKYYCKAP